MDGMQSTYTFTQHIEKVKPILDVLFRIQHLAVPVKRKGTYEKKRRISHRSSSGYFIRIARDRFLRRILHNNQLSLTKEHTKSMIFFFTICFFFSKNRQISVWFVRRHLVMLVLEKAAFFCCSFIIIIIISVSWEKRKHFEHAFLTGSCLFPVPDVWRNDVWRIIWPRSMLLLLSPPHLPHRHFLSHSQHAASLIRLM